MPASYELNMTVRVSVPSPVKVYEPGLQPVPANSIGALNTTWASAWLASRASAAEAKTTFNAFITIPFFLKKNPHGLSRQALLIRRTHVNSLSSPVSSFF
jgi:hypothetical protein